MTEVDMKTEVEEIRQLLEKMRAELKEARAALRGAN
jgi:hypothetical protein